MLLTIKEPMKFHVPDVSPSFTYVSSIDQQQHSETYAKAQREVYEFIRAKVGIFEEIHFGKIIKTGNGDIAYHFVLHDPSTHDDFIAGKYLSGTVKVYRDL